MTQPESAHTITYPLAGRTVTDPDFDFDWRGLPYAVGELIIYPRMNGRSVEMMEAQVIAFRDGKVEVRPLRSSRWASEQWKTRDTVLIKVTDNITKVER